MLRAFAALAVVAYHADHEAIVLAQATGRSYAPPHIFPWPAAVDLFFVISGFIMVHSSEKLFARPGGVRVFITRRIIRVVPVYWAVTLLFLCVVMLSPGSLNSPRPEFSEIVRSLFFIPYMRPDGVVQPVYSLGWTLNYEMYFYALFAVAVMLPRTIAVACVAALLSASVYVRTHYSLPEPFAFWSDPIVLEFAGGMGIALIARRGVTLPFWLRAAMCVLAFAVLLADLMPQLDTPLARVIAYGIPAFLLVASSTLIGGASPGHPPLWERAFVMLGDATYSLYLLHPFAVRFIRQALVATPLGAHVPIWAFMVAAFAASIVVGLIAYRLFERPMTEALRRRAGV